MWKWMLVFLCAALTPLYAQQQTTTAANETMGTNPNAVKPAPKGPPKAKKSDAEHHKHARVFADSTRLAAILEDTQGKATIDAASWKRIANESDALANRIYADTGGNATAHKAARELRTHVREMRTAALKGDADGAKDHAAKALPYAYTIIDWAS